MIGDSGSGINFDWEVVCSSLRLKWLILEIVFNVLMKLCPWGSFSMKILFIVSIFGDSHCEDFLFLEIFSWRFFFLKFFLWDCSIVKICSMLILRLKNCFSLLVLRLKIFVLVIWLRVIGLGLDFKMDANSGLELGILIDSGSDLKFEMIFRLWLFIWAGFLHNWVDFVVS